MQKSKPKPSHLQKLLTCPHDCSQQIHNTAQNSSVADLFAPLHLWSYSAI